MTRLSVGLLLLATTGFTQIALANSEYDAFLKENRFDVQAAQQEFQDYMDENDKEFVGFLKQQWKKVDLETPIVLDTTPKPINLPVAPPEVDKPINTLPTHPKQPIVVIKPTPPHPAKPVEPNKPVVTIKADQITVTFFGHDIPLPKVKARPFRFNNTLSSKSIANHWGDMSKQKHTHLIAALKQQKQRFALNDWALAMLVNEYGKSLGLNDASSQQLFTWFIMVKAGYDARLAYNHQAFILMPSKQALFGVTYFTLSHKKYYAVSFNDRKVNAGRAYTYSGKHGDAIQDIDFSGASKGLPSNQQASKALRFSYNGLQHTVTLEYDLALVQFSNSLPQMDIQYYPQQGLPDDTSKQLLDQLTPLVKGKSELEAVNLLLRFVQTAFAYQTDEQQFDQENYLLPIETLHYPYSDCEDRAAIFSWLVESLLGLDAVILDYPGHIAAAVHLGQTSTGDKLRFNGRLYTVTDPTYINANAGMTMPQFKNTQPKILNF